MNETALLKMAKQELENLNQKIMIRDDADNGNYATPFGSVWISEERVLIEKQLVSLSAFLQQNPKSVEAVRLKSLYLKRLGQVPTMIDFLLANEDLFPQDVNLYNDLVGAYLILNRLPEAEKLLSKLQADKNSMARTFYHSALLAEKKGDIDAAISFYEKALRESITYSSAQFRLAFLLEKKDPQHALAAYKKCLELNPHHFGAAKKAALLYLQIGDSTQGRIFLRLALSLYPQDTECLYHLFCLEGVKEIEAAEAKIKEATKANPETTAAIAFAYLKLGRREKFLEYYDLEKFVSVYELNHFSSSPDIAHINEKLRVCLESMETLILDFNTSRADGRYYTLDLMPDVEKHKPLQFFIENINKQVKDILGKGQVSSFFSSKAPANYTYWFDGSITDPGAKIEAHLHTGNNWGTFVYYVHVPKLAGAQPANASCIEFGRPNFKIDLDIPTRIIQPKNGMLVFFPSWIYHKTYPYHSPSKERRVTMNLDVMPL